MSHDQGLPWARHTHSSRSSAKPALDRPSLFAGMEAEEDHSPERVRILSTLAANRPPSKRASHRARARRGRSNWQFRALMILMGMGIVGLLAGFALVLAQGHPQARPVTVANESALRPTTAHTTPPAALATQHAASQSAAPSTPPSPANTTPQTALIEDLAPAAAVAVATVAATSPPSSPVAAPLRTSSASTDKVSRTPPVTETRDAPPQSHSGRASPYGESRKAASKGRKSPARGGDKARSGRRCRLAGGHVHAYPPNQPEQRSAPLVRPTAPASRVPRSALNKG